MVFPSKLIVAGASIRNIVLLRINTHILCVSPLDDIAVPELSGAAALGRRIAVYVVHPAGEGAVFKFPKGADAADVGVGSGAADV